MKRDYMEALVYKGLLLRLQANLEKDANKQKALLKEADELRDKAQAIRKPKNAGAGATAAASPSLARLESRRPHAGTAGAALSFQGPRWNQTSSADSSGSR